MYLSTDDDNNTTEATVATLDRPAALCNVLAPRDRERGTARSVYRHRVYHLSLLRAVSSPARKDFRGTQEGRARGALIGLFSFLCALFLRGQKVSEDVRSVVYFVWGKALDSNSLWVH